MSWLRALFAWRDVRDSGVWRYRENAVTGVRVAVRVGAGGYQPVDLVWLKADGRQLDDPGATRHLVARPPRPGPAPPAAGGGAIVSDLKGHAARARRAGEIADGAVSLAAMRGYQAGYEQCLRDVEAGVARPELALQYGRGAP